MSDYDMLINKYRALSAIYAFLKMLVVFLQFLIPALIVFFYLQQINPWYIVAGTILYVLGSRILWVQFDLKSVAFKIVSDKMKKKKSEMMNSIFR